MTQDQSKQLAQQPLPAKEKKPMPTSTKIVLGCLSLPIAITLVMTPFSIYSACQKTAEQAAIEAAKTPEQREAERLAKEAEEAKKAERARVEQEIVNKEAEERSAASEIIKSLANRLETIMSESGAGDILKVPELHDQGYHRRRDEAIQKVRQAAAKTQASLKSVSREYGLNSHETLLQSEMRGLYSAADSYCWEASQAAQKWKAFFNRYDRQDFDAAATSHRAMQAKMNEFGKKRAILLRVLGKPGALEMLSEPPPIQIVRDKDGYAIDKETGRRIGMYLEDFLKEHGD